MSESTTPAQCRDEDWSLARDCGLMAAAPGTNAWDAALARFADAVRSTPAVSNAEAEDTAYMMGHAAGRAASQSAEPVAWLHDSDPTRVISAAQKAQALRDGGASASSVRPYSLAAYATPRAATGAQLTDEQILAIRDGIKYGDGWDGDQWDLAFARAILAQAAPSAYKDSTSQLKVGDSSFESWYSSYTKDGRSGLKQLMRDAYAAGMGDPLVIAAAAPTASPVYDKSVVKRIATQIGWTPPGASPAALTDEQREKVCEAVAGALGNAYDCLRVWSAWGMGTMGSDDFAPVAEDASRVAEIAGAAIAAILAASPATASAAMEQVPEAGAGDIARWEWRETSADDARDAA